MPGWLYARIAYAMATSVAPGAAEGAKPQECNVSRHRHDARMNKCQQYGNGSRCCHGMASG